MFWIVPDGHAHTIKFPQQSSCGICTKLPILAWRSRKKLSVIQTSFIKMVRINLPKMFKELMIKVFFSKCAEQLENVSAGNWASIVTGEGHYKKAQLRDQLPEVANLITRRVPTRIRKVTKRPTKLQGRKVVRALFTDCASLSKFCGAEKLFVRISKGRVRFAAPWGRFTISFGETQFQQYSALFYGNGWKPLFCNIDTTQGPSNIVGYTGVKVVMGFILETVWCSGNKFFKILLPCATSRLETVLPGLRVKGTVGWVPQQFFSFINCKLPFFYSRQEIGKVNTLSLGFRPFSAIDGVVQWGA